MRKKWLRNMFTFALVMCVGIAFAVEPWAMWNNFTGLNGYKGPDFSTVQNGFAGSGFTFNLGSGVVNDDGSISTTGGDGVSSPYMDFNRSDINVGYNHNPVTVVMTIEMPSSLPVDNSGNVKVKPLVTIGASGKNGIGLTLRALSDSSVVFGGAWGNSSWQPNDTSKQITLDTIKPGQKITLVVSTPSGAFQLKQFNNTACESLGSISGLTGQTISATRMTFGNYHNSSADTMAFRIHKVALYRGVDIPNADIAVHFPELISGAATRTLDTVNETWGNAQKWSGSAIPENGASAVLTVAAESVSTLELDQNVSLNELLVKGSSGVVFAGQGSLSVAKSVFGADVDASGIVAALGDVMVSEGKKLTISGTSAYTTIARSANSTLKITGDITELPLADNAVTETSGDVVLADGVGETLKGRCWKLSGGVSSVPFLYLAAGKDWGNSGNRSSFIMSDGAKLTVTSDSSTIGRDKTDGAVMFAECGNGSTVTISGIGTEFKVPNGALNLSRDGTTTATVSDGALLQAYKLGGTDRASVLTVTNATLKIGKEGATDGVIKMTACKLNLQDATLEAAGDWSVAADSTESQIEVSGVLTIKTEACSIKLRNVTFQETAKVVVVGGGTVDLGACRPKLDTLGGSVVLEATADEIAAGVITLPTTQESYPSVTFAVVDSSGATIPVLETTIANSTITLGIESHSFKSDTSTSQWAGMTGTVYVKNDNEDTAITVTVDAAFPSGVVGLDVRGKVVINVASLESYGGSVILNIAEGSEVTVRGGWPFAGVTGSGALILESLTISSDNSSFSGSCTIAAGTVKMGHYNCFGPWGRTILVKAGATLDSNGVGNNGVWSGNTYILNLEEGAKYTNTKQPNTDIKLAFPVSRIELSGNAIIEAKDYDCGMTKHYHYGTTVALGEYTLTATGGKTVWFSDCVFTGSGTFSIVGNTTVQLTRNYYNNNIRSESEIYVDKGSQILLNGYGEGPPAFTINKAIVVNGELNSDHANGSYAVNSSLSGSGMINAAMTLGANAVIKPDGAGCPTFSVAPTSAREGGVLAVEVSDEVLNSRSKVKILRVTDASLLPDLGLFTGVPKGWSIKKSHDGLGVDFVKQTFYLFIR